MGSGVKARSLGRVARKEDKLKRGSELEQACRELSNRGMSSFSYHVFVVARVDLTRALEEGHGLGVEHEVLLVFCGRNIMNGRGGGCNK